MGGALLPSNYKREQKLNVIELIITPIHAWRHAMTECHCVTRTDLASSHTGHRQPYTNTIQILYLGGSGEILFVNQSNFFLNNNADWHPSSRNTQQEYSFHLYCGGASPTKHTILTILCNYAPASGKSRPVSPNASHSWFKHLDSLHIYSIGAAIRKNDEWNSLDGPKWRHTLTSVQIQCTVRWNYARWGQIWTYKKKKKKKKRL